MKPDPLRRQVDLFDSDAQPAAVLPCQQEELVNLLSQLLWEVVSAHTVVNLEGDDEQDRP
jgi:hypothetical protein